MCRALDSKWDNELKGQVVLFEWVNFLQYEALKYLGISEMLDLTWIYSPLATRESFTFPLVDSQADPRALRDVRFQGGDLLEYLKDYDKLQRKLAFHKASHVCKVCFSEKTGAQCIEFPNCRHAYCRQCMANYFRSQIADGNVKHLTCPEEKCTSQPTPAQVTKTKEPVEIKFHIFL